MIFLRFVKNYFFFAVLNIPIVLIYAQNTSESAPDTSDSLKIKARRDLNILLNLPENSNILKKDSLKAAKKASIEEMNLNSPLYQKGLHLFKSALAAYVNGNYKKAISLFRQVIEIDPLHKNAYEYLNKAQESFKREKDPDVTAKRADEQHNIKNEMIFQSGMEHYLKRDYPAAIKIWRQLIRQAPDFKKAFVYIKKAEDKIDAIADNFLNQGLYYFQKGNIQKAIVEWERGLKECPGNEKLAAQLALAKVQRDALIQDIVRDGEDKIKQGQYEEALQILSTGLQKYPHSKALKKKMASSQKYSKKFQKEKMNTAKSLYKKGKYEAALNVFRDILLINPDNLSAKEYGQKAKQKLKLERKRRTFSAIFKEGVHALGQMHFQEAMDKFSAIEKEDPSYPGLKEKIKEAAKVIEAIKKKKRITVAFNKGLNHYKKGYFKSALKEWKKVLKEDPGNEMVKQYVDGVRNNLANAVARRQQRNQDEKKAFNLNKDAISLYKKKNYPEACQALEKAQQLDPNNTVIRKGLKACRKEMLKQQEKNTPVKARRIKSFFHQGISYYRKGNYKKAIECWKKVVSLQPDHKKAQKYIENVSKKMEKIERI